LQSEARAALGRVWTSLDLRPAPSPTTPTHRAPRTHDGQAAHDDLAHRLRVRGLLRRAVWRGVCASAHVADGTRVHADVDMELPDAVQATAWLTTGPGVSRRDRVKHSASSRIRELWPTLSAPGKVLGLLFTQQP